MTEADLMELRQARDDELYTLVGMYALPFIEPPSSALRLGRSRSLFGAGTVLGDEANASQPAYVNLGKRFLARWAEQLRNAVCKNDALYSELQQDAARELKIVVALVVGAIATGIPALAPASGLLTILGVMVAKAGVKGFCAAIEDAEKESTE